MISYSIPTVKSTMSSPEDCNRKRTYQTMNQYPGNISTFVPAVFSPLFQLMTRTLSQNGQPGTKRRKIFSEKWVHSLQLNGFREDEVKVSVESNQVVLHAKKCTNGLEIKRRIFLPEYVNKDTIKSCLKDNGMFVIEAEYKNRPNIFNKSNICTTEQDNRIDPSSLREKNPSKDKVTVETSLLKDTAAFLKEKFNNDVIIAQEDPETRKLQNPESVLSGNEKNAFIHKSNTMKIDGCNKQGENDVFHLEIIKEKMESDSVSVKQEEKQYSVTLDVSLLKEENMDVKFKNGVIIVEAEQRFPQYDEMCRSETLYRHFDLPSNVSPDKILCKLNDKGVLTVCVPFL